MKSFYSLIFLAVAARSVAADNSVCFYPDGITTEPNHVPCNSTISTSSCCDPIDVCTNSGLCLGRTGFNYRGSCTDKTWTSPNCASECLADPSNRASYNSFTPLVPCAPGGQLAGNYCCSSPNAKNCCTIATFNYGNTGSAFKPGMDRLFQELASLSANASGSSVTTTVTVTASPTSAPTASQQQNNETSGRRSNSSDLGAAVGAGVGVPLGILAIGILGFLFYRERRHSHSHFGDRLTMGSRRDVLEMEPRKGYYPSSSPPPPPPPPPQTQLQHSRAPPHVPLVEAGGQTIVHSNLSTGEMNSMEKSPRFSHRPASDIHEMI